MHRVPNKDTSVLAEYYILCKKYEMIGQMHENTMGDLGRPIQDGAYPTARSPADRQVPCASIGQSLTTVFLGLLPCWSDLHRIHGTGFMASGLLF